MTIKKKVGVAGIAIWDHGEYNRNGRHYCQLFQSENFYHDDFRYKLREYRTILDALEIQKEALYQFPNRGWDKITSFYSMHDFLPFLIRNSFLSLHLRALACDITSIKESNRNWCINETKAGIHFGFTLMVDGLTLHPGALTSSLNKDKGLGINVDWNYAVSIHQKRTVLFYDSLYLIIKYFIEEAITLEKRIADDLKRFGNHSSLASKIYEYREIRQKETNDGTMDERQLLFEITREIKSAGLPIHLIRYLINPDRGIHLCLENVEPFNFLINLPSQHKFWYQKILELYDDILNHSSLEPSLYEKYKPKLVVDTNHYLNSQYILKSHPELEHIFGDGFSEVFRPFVSYPGEYGEIEPLLNRMIRQSGDDIFFYHLAGAVRKDYFLTHERIQPFRTHVATTEDELGKPIFRYGLNNFDPNIELNLEEVIQVIGAENIFILEVFNASSEAIKNSQENVKSFLNYVASLRRLFQRKLLVMKQYHELSKNAYEEWNLDNAGFFIKPHSHQHYQQGGVGFDELKFFRWKPNSRYKYKILATMKENQEIWINH